MRISTSMQTNRLNDVYNSKYFKTMTRNIEEEKTKESKDASKENTKITNEELKETNKDVKSNDEKKIKTSKDDTKEASSKNDSDKNHFLSKEDEQMKVFKEFMKYHNNQRFNSEIDTSDIRIQNMKSMMLRANMSTSLLNYM